MRQSFGSNFYSQWSREREWAVLFCKAAKTAMQDIREISGLFLHPNECITENTKNYKLKRIVSGVFNIVFCQNHYFKSFVLTEMIFWFDLATNPGILHLGNTITALIWCFLAGVISPQLMKFWCSYIAACSGAHLLCDSLKIFVPYSTAQCKGALSHLKKTFFLMSFSCFQTENRWLLPFLLMFSAYWV